MSDWKRYGYLLALITPALVPAAAWLALNTSHPDLAAAFPLFFLFVLLPLADYAIGGDRQNPDDETSRRLERDPFYRALTIACLPIQLLTLAASAYWFTQLPLSVFGQALWIVAQGVVSGVLAINVAHELIHKNERLDQICGGLLLCSVNYFGFKIEHVRGHHVHVSTPHDASSARFGEIVYPFVLRALLRNARNAWRLEVERLTRLGLPSLHWRNELLVWAGVTVSMAALLGVWLGPTAVLFFFAQGLCAAMTLEVINYVEHYGLERRLLANGRYERTTHLHSWNSNYLLTNLMLFQLQRHSDHHETAKRRYQGLRHYDASPQLPGGYAAMFVLALCPPLWRAVIDPRVRRFYASAPVN